MTIVGPAMSNTSGSSSGGGLTGFASRSVVRAATTAGLTLAYSSFVLNSPIDTASIQNALLIGGCATLGETVSRSILPELHLEFTSARGKQFQDIAVQVGVSSVAYSYAYPMVFGGAGATNRMALMRLAALLDGTSMLISDRLHDLVVGEDL